MFTRINQSLFVFFIDCCQRFGASLGGKPPYNQGSSLMRKHGLRVLSREDCSVEGCVLAIGQAMCYRNVKYAPRMNRDAVVFLSSWCTQF